MSKRYKVKLKLCKSKKNVMNISSIAKFVCSAVHTEIPNEPRGLKLHKKINFKAIQVKVNGKGI